MTSGTRIPTRVAFGEALLTLAETHPEIVVVDADLRHSTGTLAFAKKYPARAYNVGIAEQNLVGISTGLALTGKTVFACSFAAFATGRCFDQIRQSVCYSQTNVKIVGTHAGLLTGEDGATHQALEDIALMRALPNMRVFCPADAEETKQVVTAIVNDKLPAYLRLGRSGVPAIYDSSYQFQIGKGSILREGNDLTIIATGTTVESAIFAAEKLALENFSVRVVNLCSLKPIDEKLILESAKKCRRVVTAEDHSVIGGLGSAVAEILSEQCPTPLLRLGMRDEFGESGKGEELLKKYGLDGAGVLKSVRKFLESVK